MKGKIFFFLILFFFTFIRFSYAEEGARVEQFSPQGTVKGIRQVAVRFSEPMVPLGDPRGLLEPFEINCPPKGTGRWADSKNWAFDFEKDLPPGVRCEFTLKAGLKSLSGKEMVEQKSFSFSTGGPAIQRTIPFEGSGNIDEEQIFILMLDGEADAESILHNVNFSVEGLQDRVGGRIVEGKEKEQILKARFRQIPKTPILLFQSKQRFPSAAKISLVWGKGVRSKSGLATENDQVLRFQTRKAFQAEFRCERENANAGCIPIKPFTLNFSGPIPKDQANKITLTGPGGKRWKPHFDDREEIMRVFFRGPFPEKAKFIVELPPGLKDDAGRPLTNADKFPFAVQTDHYPPLAKFSSRFGILESKTEPLLPVTVRNLEPSVKAKMMKVGPEEEILSKLSGKILNVPSEKGDEIQGWLRRVASASRETSLLGEENGAKGFTLPKPMGPQAFEVVGIPVKGPGFYVVELESALLGAALLDPPRPMFVPAAVLVTNLSVHFKWGKESSLVWVTSLDRGEPVSGAAITIRDCQEKILWTGTTDADGLARIATSLPSGKENSRCTYKVEDYDSAQMGALRSLDHGLFIVAQTSNDLAFVHSSWNQGIEPWRFQLPGESDRGSIVAHTIFDRTLLRAGETVHMKHILRQKTMKGLSVPGQSRRPSSLAITHLGSDTKYEFPLNWDGRGVAETTWKIPQEGKLGIYQVTLIEKVGPKQIEEWTSGQFRVEEFRVPLLKATLQPPTEPLIDVREVPLLLSVQYLAGGGARDLPVKLRSEISPKWISPFEGFEHFLFANGTVKEEKIRRGEALEFEEEETESPQNNGQRIKLPGADLVLDASGSGRTMIAKLPKVDAPKEILAELEFKDPNGEVQTVSARIPLWPSRYLVGIKADSWTTSQGPLNFQVAVLDLSGKPVPGASVKVEFLERKTFSHRKRLVGGFYAYEHSEETKRVAPACEGKTDGRGLLICEARSPAAGNLILQAESTDERGNPATAHRDIWVHGKEDAWFAVEDHDRIDVLPDKRLYEPGETAAFQVRMPFREATALITVEREGVLEAYVRRISGKSPVVPVAIQGTHAPNIFVSVLAVRGRVGGAQPTAMVDLGRPAYKLGIAEVKVGWKDSELKVAVSPERRVYRVRQKVKARISVKTLDGKNPPAGSEVALAAVDEGLLELMPNRSWQILPVMMGRRGYGVSTATAQGQVIGKRHFGLKALPQGGGGGRQVTRELFDTLLFWKGRLPLDENGEAWAEIPLNDSITSFRIVAVATGGENLFGTGSASIQSTQDLMIFSGLAPLIREGDRFRGEFTIRNTTDRPMQIDLKAKVEGLPGSLEPHTLSLVAGEAKEAGWNIIAPLGVERLRWEVEVAERGSPEKDRILVSQKIVPAVPVRTFQATIAQIEKDLQVPIERPIDSLPGRGGVQVTLRPKIADGLSGVTAYMRDYPYGCLEQKISVAVSLRDETLWKSIMSQLPSHLDADGLAKYFPPGSYGDPILTSYILAIGHEAGFSIPKESKEKMEGGLRKFIDGSVRRYSRLETADLSIKKLSALEALSRTGKVDPKLFNSISVEPNLWPTSAVIDWLNILLHIKTVPNREARMREAEQIIRSRLNFQGTTMGFSTERSDCLWWLMVSNDVNAIRVLFPLLTMENWKEDMPRLVNGVLARQRKGRWDLTLANAWGVLAMEKFSRVFEATAVTGSTQTSLSGGTKRLDWNSSAKGETFLFPWPPKMENLAIAHRGEGKPWATVRSLAALPLKEPFASGYMVKKTMIPLQQKRPDQWSPGDILRIRLEMEAQADQTWVVLNDPIPGGSTILGRGLERDSTLLTRGEERQGWVWPAFEERSFEAFRAYYEYVPKGNWTVEYTVRLNQSGLFHLPNTRVEALYFPEMLGEIPNPPVEVRP